MAADAQYHNVPYSLEDIYDFSRLAWLEARGDGISACWAVMHCVFNRLAAPDFPRTLYGIIRQPKAFSCMTPGNPEYGLVPPTTDAVWRACRELAPFVLSGDEDDPTKHPVTKQHAVYYANLQTMTKGGWFERHISGPEPYLGLPGHEFTVKIGKHSYYL